MCKSIFMTHNTRNVKKEITQQHKNELNIKKTYREHTAL